MGGGGCRPHTRLFRTDLYRLSLASWTGGGGRGVARTPTAGTLNPGVHPRAPPSGRPQAPTALYNPAKDRLSSIQTPLHPGPAELDVALLAADKVRPPAPPHPVAHLSVGPAQTLSRIWERETMRDLCGTLVESGRKGTRDSFTPRIDGLASFPSAKNRLLYVFSTSNSQCPAPPGCCSGRGASQAAPPQPPSFSFRMRSAVQITSKDGAVCFVFPPSVLSNAMDAHVGRSPVFLCQSPWMLG